MEHLMLKVFYIVLAGLCFSQGVSAHDPTETGYDRISLDVSARMEVPNDRLLAELYVQREGEDAGRLADEVNRAIDWAVSEARQVPAVEVQTLGYRTHPLYHKQTLTGWRVRQALRLKSADTTVLSDLIGRLQARLVVESVGYELSAHSRRAAESELTDEAIQAFRQRARQVAEQFGRSDYRLVKADIHGGAVQPQPMFRGAMLSVEADAVTTPRLDPGSQTVQVTVSGVIELQLE
jgi:predicted secreted protein